MIKDVIMRESPSWGQGVCSRQNLLSRIAPSDQPLIFEHRAQQLRWGDGVRNRRNLGRRPWAGADDAGEVGRVGNSRTGRFRRR